MFNTMRYSKDRWGKQIMKSNAVKKEIVTVHEVEQALALRETLQGLKKRMDLIETSLQETETTIISKLDAGADFSSCGYSIFVKEVQKRYPSWKEEFLSRLGKSEADAVMETTEPKIYRNLI